MRMNLAFIVTLGLGGCGSEDKPAEPSPCSASDRTGTYIFQYVERAGGNCGPVDDEFLTLNGGGVPPGCRLDEPDVWSEDGCTLERSYTCPSNGLGQGWTTRGNGITTQESSSGAIITGFVSITIYDDAKLPVCTSSYDLTATRQ
jgi:hypothetical protein